MQSQPTRRSSIMLLVLPVVAAVFCCSGCASVRQVQHFEVIGKPHPVTGIAPKSYFKMTIEGRGGGLVKYKMRAAYVSATTLDLMNGKLPNLPGADLSEQNLKVFDDIKKDYLSALKQYSTEKKREDTKVSDPARHEQNIIAIARQGWLASLADQDFMSMGQYETTDPYKFRKLVFYASAMNLDLTQYDAEINSVIDKTASLIEGMRQRKAARKQEKNTLGDGLRGIAETYLTSNPQAKAALEAMANLHAPAENGE
ncbi:MAG: hypothetical protein JSU63_06270 [Phycisphaerales bacterium]|nr:MAG: hypothetical protein JSU63_06270 [Phycisphaerales bacterium]